MKIVSVLAGLLRGFVRVVAMNCGKCLLIILGVTRAYISFVTRVVGKARLLMTFKQKLQWMEIDRLILQALSEDKYTRIRWIHQGVNRRWSRRYGEFPTRAQVQGRLRRLEARGLVSRKWYERGHFKFWGWKKQCRAPL
jgi:hypothetical protein